MNTPSHSHLALIPTYNTGSRVLETVREARRHWNPVWVVVDGSTDGSAEALQLLAQDDPGTKVMVLPQNCGKGAAVLHGARAAATAGCTHVLVMDADGQHPAPRIPEFLAASAARVQGRKLSNALAHLETLWAGIGDTLYEFRVYPLEPLLDVMESRRSMRGFDFDPEAAIRLCWRSVRPVNLPGPVRYFRREEGGVPHFHYLRDNALLTWMHLRLLTEFLLRLPVIAWRRLRRS